MKETEINTTILKVFFKHRKQIAAITLFFCLGSIGITFLLPKKYTAEAVVYPTASNNIKDVVNNLEFGYELHTDRLIQLFESEEMQNKIVKDFDLIVYYALDTTQPNWYHQLQEQYKKDIALTRTPYLSLVVKASLEDPFLAADVVNTMIEYVDTIRRNILFENVFLLQNSMKEKVVKQQAIVSDLLASIAKSKSNEAKNPIAESSLNKVQYKKHSGNVGAGDAVIEDVLINNYSLEVEELIAEYYLQQEELSRLKKELAKIEETLSLPFPGIYVVKRAFPDEQKTSPSLFIYALLGIIFGLSFSFLYYSGKYNWKRIKTSLSEG